MLAQVKGVKEGKEYEVETGIGHEANFKTRKHLVCAHSTSIQPFPITVMSNKPLVKDDVYTWCKNMNKENKDLPDDDDLQVSLGKGVGGGIGRGFLHSLTRRWRIWKRFLGGGRRGRWASHAMRGEGFDWRMMSI